MDVTGKNKLRRNLPREMAGTPTPRSSFSFEALEALTGYAVRKSLKRDASAPASLILGHGLIQHGHVHMFMTF